MLRRAWCLCWLAFFLVSAVPGASAQDEMTDGVPVSAAIAARALAEAGRYADVTYEVEGERRRGVAYLWGGRMSVDEFLAAIQAGSKPGREAGADASSVAVNAYLAADPDFRFAAEWNGGRRLVQDATSTSLFRWNIMQVAVTELRPGDLLFFQGSDGDVAGVAVFERMDGPNVHFVVASARAEKVIRTFLNVNNEYWRTRFKAAGRPLQFSR